MFDHSWVIAIYINITWRIISFSKWFECFAASKNLHFAMVILKDDVSFQIDQQSDKSFILGSFLLL